MISDEANQISMQQNKCTIGPDHILQARLLASNQLARPALGRGRTVSGFHGINDRERSRTSRAAPPGPRARAERS